MPMHNLFTLAKLLVVTLCSNRQVSAIAELLVEWWHIQFLKIFWFLIYSAFAPWPTSFVHDSVSVWCDCLFSFCAAGLISFTVLFYVIFLTTAILLYIFYASNVSDTQCYTLLLLFLSLLLLPPTSVLFLHFLNLV